MDHTTGTYTDITEFGSFHDANDHSEHDSLHGGRTAITTEAMVAYNGMRAFFGEDPVEMTDVGEWAFANNLTNNTVPYGDDLNGVGLYYAMQGAKVAWIRDDAYDPQILADIQRLAREGKTDEVMAMVEEHGHAGFADYLRETGLMDAFVNTLKMEPHYGGWMHGRVHGWLDIPGEDGAPVAIAHDINHLTVLSHDQTQPFMNDTFDYPQWPALEVEDQDVIDYFQSMLVLGEPLGDELAALPAETLTAQRDNFVGTAQGDKVDGLAGNDKMDGQGGDDIMNGGQGNDVMYGGGGSDRMMGDDGKDLLFGSNGEDMLSGGAGQDKIIGGNGSDLIMGGAGGDNLRGGKGADELIDGAGEDLLVGHEGKDIFTFVDDGKVDMVGDYTDNVDKISIQGGSFAELKIYDHNDSYVIIEYGDEAIILRDTDSNLSASDLTASDFLFA